MEFLYNQSPESMRSTALALYWIAIAMGNYAGTLIVSPVHKHSGMKSNWLPNRNLNRGRLECYYWLVSGIQAGVEPEIFVWRSQVATLIYLSRQPHTHT